MRDIDPVDGRLEELRNATEDLGPPDRFDDLVWSHVERRASRLSPLPALFSAALAAVTSFVAAYSSDAQLAEQVLVLGDDASVEAP